MALSEISIARASQVPMTKSFRVVCRIIELFCSFKYEQGWANDSITSPSQMNAYVRVQLLNHTNTCIIPENPITAQLIWVRCSDQNWDKDQFTLGSQVFLQMLNSVHLWRLAREWKDFLPPILWFLYQDASFHERVRSHEYVQLLGQRSTHSLQGSDLYQRADVETFLRNSKCNVRLSSDEHKHHNVCQLG